MRALNLVVATVAVLGLAACPGPHSGAIPCANDQICNIETGGKCLASPLNINLCAYPTGDCASGLEWGPNSGSLSSECVTSDVDASVIDAPIDAGTNAVVVTFQPADLVLGQPDFISETRNNGGITDRSLAEPTGVGADGTALWVADTNNGRAMKWPTAPAVSFAAATGLLGRSTFTDASATTTITAGNISNATCCGFNVVGTPTKVVVTDLGRHRVMVWTTTPTSLGQAPDFYLGQTSGTSGSFGTSATKLKQPSGAWTDGTRLVIADRGNNRVLIWTTFPTTNGEPADLVLGQGSFTTTTAATGATGMSIPQAIAIAGGALFVADGGNDRVLVYPTIPSTSGTAASLVLGQPSLNSIGADNTVPTQNNLDDPSSLVALGPYLYVADHEHHRVVRYALNL